MTKSGKIIYVIGSVAIGVIALLGILFGMIATGVIDSEQRTVVFASGSACEVYNATALTCDEWSIKDGALKEGHHAKVTITGTQTNVGSSINYISVVILDENDADVTEKYTLEYAPGTLQVTPRPLQLQSESAEKVYDGTPLSAPTFSRESGSMIEGHSVVVSSAALLTTPGELPNDLAISILDADDEDQSANYDISFLPGTLRILKRDITLKSGTAEKFYDGEPLSCKTLSLIEVEPNSTLLPGHSCLLGDAEEVTDPGEYPNTFTAKIVDAESNDVTHLYNIIYEKGMLRVLKRDITLKSGSATKTYDGTPLVCDTPPTTDDLLLEGHFPVLLSCASVTNAGKYDNTFTARILDANSNDVTHLYNITYLPGTLTIEARKIVLKSCDDSKFYDGLPLTCPESDGYTLIECSLVEGDTLNVFTPSSITNVGEIKNDIYATVQNASGDVSHNYSIIYRYGKLIVQPRPLTITTESKEQIYDGTPLSNDTHSLASGTLIEGDQLIISMPAAITNAGSIPNTPIYDILANGVSVLHNYAVTVDAGTLTVTKRQITITTGSNEKTYDGTPLSNDEYTLVSGTLVGEDQLSVSMRASITNAGKISNTPICDVLANGVSVLNNYEIKVEAGVLTVTKRKITITTGSGEKIYDGTPLSNDEYTLVSGTLAGEEQLTVTMRASITNAGSIPNAPIYDILSNGISVLNNYEVKVEAGVLTVTKRRITIETKSDQKVYDGMPLYNEYCEIILGEPVAGQIFVKRTPVSITDVGQRENTPAFDIRLGNGDSVKDNYEITSIIGTLTVFPRTLTIITGSAEKEHDGTPLTCSDYSVAASTEVVAGHDLRVETTGSQLSIGTSFNTATVTVLDETGKDVTNNYNIDLVKGKLVVTSPAGESGGSGSGGGEITLDGSGNSSDEPLMEVYSDIKYSFHAAAQYGSNYKSGCSWNRPNTGYSELIDGKYSANYLTAALATDRLTEHIFKVQNNRSSYVLPAYLSLTEDGYTIQTNEFYNHGTPSDSYSVRCYTEEEIKALLADGPHTGEYADYERNYRNYVYNNYLSVPEREREYLLGIIAEQGFDKDDPYIIEKVRKYVQSAARYVLDEVKNSELDNADFMIKAFLEGKEGVCRHYATTATLLYRTLGIPARYVVGVLATTKPNEWVTITGKQGHAWTEVYLDGYGWITIDATGMGDGGGAGGDHEEQNKPELKLRPTTAYMKYETGCVLNPPTTVAETSGLLTKLLSEGYTYHANCRVNVPSRYAPGYYKSEIISFVLYDPDEKDVTNDYKISLNEGVFHIYMYEITISSGSATKTYDATPLSCSEQPVLSKGGLAGGHTLTCSNFASRTNVGTSINRFSYEITNAQGEDVKYLYKINPDYGHITVTHASITVTSNSDTKSYDGTPLTNSGLTYSPPVEGHKVVATVVGEQLKVGKSANIIDSVVILDENDADVTENYRIEYVYGVLKVTRPSP